MLSREKHFSTSRFNGLKLDFSGEDHDGRLYSHSGRLQGQNLTRLLFVGLLLRILLSTLISVGTYMTPDF